ncbi:hypothetical protein chiPu_0020654 [Chiloscyllium punctatum]|uniref:Uncharacterized protein n=1 Tax=Chiloscyllium punctatum TaxID=137246 RepID=A0A401RHZ5_CHIPU|nr:hypothetical protein [Chiloscyllium punctatum]
MLLVPAPSANLPSILIDLNNSCHDRNGEISAQGSEGTAGSFQQHIGMGAWDTEGAPRPGLIRDNYMKEQDSITFSRYKAKCDQFLLTNSRYVIAVRLKTYFPQSQSS